MRERSDGRIEGHRREHAIRPPGTDFSTFPQTTGIFPAFWYCMPRHTKITERIFGIGIRGLSLRRGGWRVPILNRDLLGIVVILGSFWEGTQQILCRATPDPNRFLFNIRRFWNFQEIFVEKSCQRTRIHPSLVRASVRIGDSVDIPFNVTEPEIYPAELYYLMDVSYSMRNDMEKMKRMGGEIAKKETAWIS